MMVLPRLRSGALASALSFLAHLASVSAAEPGGAVAQSEREIPLAYDVDVVVVGGSSGAVAAAASAAAAGAKVFLASPRPYLGEDMCATMRLFLEKGERPLSPLGEEIFHPKGALARTEMPSLKFEYVTNIAPSAKRDDSKGLPKLSDGVAGDTAKDCVQYDGDVVVTADLGKPQFIEDAKVATLFRAGDFEPDTMTVSISDDRENWKEAGSSVFPEPSAEDADSPSTAVVPVKASARYVRIKVDRAKGASRLLLSEVALAPQPTEEQKSAKPEEWRGPVTPGHVKKTFDKTLLDAGVKFLYSCYPTEVLRDSQGRLAGIVMTNRAGRQAVRAKVIVDATPRAVVARMAGAPFAPFPGGSTQHFTRIVVGGEVKTGPGLTGRKLGLSFPDLPGNAPADLIAYDIAIPMKNDAFASFSRAEQIARDLTYSKDQPIETEEIFQVPPDPVKAIAAWNGPWQDVAALPLDAFRPQGEPGLFVLGGCADMPRPEAALLMRPPALMAMGDRIGAAAAAEAKSAPPMQGLRVAGSAGSATAKGEVRELLGGLRPGQAPAALVASPATTLPVLGEYDVVVVGGGTGGAPAGIAAAREGVSTLVLEYQYSLGGVGTVGRISKYWWGYKKGFPESMPDAKGYWDPRARAEWLRREILQPGGEVWFGVLGSGAVVEGNRVKGVVVTTPLGRGVILAKEVIDATGNSDIAAAAGAETIIPGDGQIAVQGTGLPAIRWGGRDFFNSDFTLVDENDMIDVWQMQLYTRLKYPNVFDTATFIDSRERRRIVGEFTQSVLDQVNDRTYPDTINMAYSNLDAHTFSVHPYLETEHPGKTVGITARIPYRCLIPKGLEGILVTGLSMSVEHDALAVARMQANIQNQGFAIGLAAATAAREGKGVRDIDIRALQKRLIELGSLPPETLTEVDSYPLPLAKLEEAVRTLPDHYKGASFLFAQPQDAIPLLKAAFASAPDPQTKLVYAHVLGLLGDATGAPALMEFVAANPWDKGWNYKALGNFGATLSRMDSYIMTLGRLGYRPAIPVIETKASELTPASDFSHFRAIALALEDFGQASSAPVLAKLLSAPGMSGHEHADMKEILADIKPSPSDNSTRAASLRELFLARALYLCGDENGLGRKILENYSKDMRGHWVRFATDALKEKPQAPAGKAG